MSSGKVLHKKILCAHWLWKIRGNIGCVACLCDEASEHCLCRYIFPLF